MTIAVIGAGAIGGVVAAFLKKAGEDVVLIARGSQADVINAKGLTIKGVRGEETVRLSAKTQLDKAYDLVIFAVKSQDIEATYDHNSQYLENCLVLTTQNGVQADNLLSSHFDQTKQLSSIVMFGATYANTSTRGLSEGTRGLSPAPQGDCSLHAITYNFEGDWIIGRPFGPIDPTTHKIAEMLGKAFKVVIADHITGQKYLKLFVNFNNCIPALVGKSMQETFADMDLCRLSIMLLKEGLDVVKEAKIELSSMQDFPKERILGLANMPLDQAAAIINKTLTSLSKEPLYGSILQSIMRGKVSEIDFINGEVVQLASHMKMPAPLNTKMTAMVHEVERTGEFFSVDEVKETFSLVSEVRRS